MIWTRKVACRGSVVLALSAVVMGFGAGPAAAEHTSDVTAVNGLAFSYYTNVSLFGGPQMRRGYGQQVCTSTNPDTPSGCVRTNEEAASASPSVTCPSGGGNPSATDPDGAKGRYGPAVIFGGIWPQTSNSAPPSGPLTSSIDCVLGTSGRVTGSTDATLMPAGSTYPGGVGPGPFYADDVESTCSAMADGTKTASTRVTNGTLETSYYTKDDLMTPLVEEKSGDVKTSEPVPPNPPVNYTRRGTLDHIGDSYKIIFNEQITNPDGSITVNAAHMELIGPTAVGDMFIGSSTCGLTRQAVPHSCPTAGRETAVGPLGGTWPSAGTGSAGAAGIVGFGLFDGGLSLSGWAAAFSQRRRRRLATGRPAGRRSSRPRRDREGGFTLVELLVVIVILGILSAVVVFAVRGAGDKGQKAAVQTDERTIRTALEVYCSQKGTYPADPPATDKDPMDVLVDGKYLSDRSTYHELKTGEEGESFGPSGLSAQGSCPGTGLEKYKLIPTQTQTSTDPNCP